MSQLALAVLALCLAGLVPPQLHASVVSVIDKEFDGVVDALEQRSGSLVTRHAAALKLVELQGAKAAGRVLDVALQKTSSYGLQLALADVLAGLDADKVQAALLKLLRDRRTDAQTRLFALRALRLPDSARAARPLLDLFEDEDALVRGAALQRAVQLDAQLAVPVLERLLTTTRSEDELRPPGGAWLDALAGLIGERPEFGEALLGFAESPLRSARMSALQQLAGRAQLELELELAAAEDAGAEPGAATPPERGASPSVRDDPRVHALLVSSLESDDWHERAMGVLLARSLPPLVSVEPLLAALPRQSGRLLADVDAALMALTGQDFRGDAERWSAWWQSKGKPALLAPEPDPSETSKPWRRPASTLDSRGSVSTAPAAAQFFDLSVHSHNVVFVVDVSGSMDWPASLEVDPAGRAPPAHDPEAGPSRIELAREQLSAAIAQLDDQARFNIIGFNDRPRAWLTRDGMGEFGKAGKRRDDALEFVDALVPTDGTNLYGALQLAFEDPLADTIYLLSDGVASLGKLTEPDLIRRSVQAWNAHRHVVLHCIVMGLDEQQHPLARQLAEDSGGVYVTLP